MAEAFYPLKLGRGRGALGLGGRKAWTGPRGGGHRQHLEGGGRRSRRQELPMDTDRRSSSRQPAVRPPCLPAASHAQSRASTGLRPSCRLAKGASSSMACGRPGSWHASLVGGCSRVTESRGCGGEAPGRRPCLL
jgi:hypothetical protein